MATPDAVSLVSPGAPGRHERFAALRGTLSATQRSAAPEAFSSVDPSLLRSGLPELDAALGGGFPAGIIATLEGAAGSGASAVAMRMLATATARGLGALVELTDAERGAGRLLPEALAAAGVDLERLLVVPAGDTTGVARAVDILLRSAAFGVVVMPSVTLAATAWTRLASLAHRANVLLLTLGGDASHELRYFASLRLRLRAAQVRWSGTPGPFATLAGVDARATVLKHKRAVPGKDALIRLTTFETGGAPLCAIRLSERVEPSLTKSSLPHASAAAILAI